VIARTGVRPSVGRPARVHVPAALMRAIVLAVSCALPTTGAAQAATEGSVTGRVLISPVAIDLVITPSTAQVGTSVIAAATLRNLGSVALSKISVRLRAPSGLAIQPSGARSVQGFAPGTSTALSWSVCGRRPGSYLVFAEASYSGTVVDSPARLLTVTAGSGKCGGGRTLPQ
jgi:hypothetical protein